MRIEGENQHIQDDPVVGWRMKDRYRFRNPDLVAIRYATECREVFDLHEAICDLIDEERQNRICVSLLTLATMIHDHPRSGEWETQRIAAIEQLRTRGLIEFDGVVTLADELVISLPERVYRRWHEAGRKQGSNDRARDPSTGKFLPKKPALTTETPDGPDGCANGSPVDPSKTKTKTKTNNAPNGARTARAYEASGILPSATSTTGLIRRSQAQLGDIGIYLPAVISRHSRTARKPLTISDEYSQFWLPTTQLLEAHGRDRLRRAFGVAAREEAASIEFVRKVCERMQLDEERATTTPVAAATSLSDRDRDALLRIDGGELVA